MTDVTTCQTCAFFCGDLNVCRRHPPLVLEKTYDDPQGNAVWPDVQPEFDFCGEHRTLAQRDRGWRRRPGAPSSQAEQVVTP